MPTNRTDKQRDDRATGHQRIQESPLPRRDQITPPLMVDGPEAIRGSQC